ncbi:hypothetical protein HU200_032241 [Digitaria exilis]|uniref:No apical meristem-associated C-terminal domain-containing protein n=1 Tax=Digitaria exilis TaxID=1010633 RepID=A0A835BNK7_9POAL|nr:hypothetical protein HU200_032241 [Digitaria exilis]CAB3503108.1 unnamed protein product [Digitaria exilis]
MFQPPRPCAPLTGESGFRTDVAACSSPLRQVLQGFEEVEARCSDGMEFGDDLAQAAATTEDPSKRPDGKKTEKKKLRQRSTIEALDYLAAKMKETDAAKEIKKEERCNKAFALQEEKIKLEREKFLEKIKLEREQFDFQRDLEEERILSLDLSNMTYRLQQYYEGRQNEIFARRGC